MALILFDLDETIIKQDSDYAWSSFMIEEGLYDGESHAVMQRKFKDDYNKGQLDIHEYYRFVGSNLGKFSREQLEELIEKYIVRHITPHILPKAVACIDQHRQVGGYTILISATNSFVVSRIGKEFNFDKVIATNIREVDGKFQSEIDGTPSFREGKVERIKQWMADNPSSPHATWKGSWFYSDSRNDLPLLEAVENPVAVDPDDTLRQVAEERGWQILSFR